MARQHSKHCTCCYCCTDNASYVRTHSMHEQEVSWVSFRTYYLRYTSRHWNRDTPAEPISGLILFLLNLFINFAINTPLPVPIPKAITPRIKMPNVCGCKNLSAISLDPTDKPSTMVTMLIKAFCVVSLKTFYYAADAHEITETEHPE